MFQSSKAVLLPQSKPFLSQCRVSEMKTHVMHDVTGNAVLSELMGYLTICSTFRIKENRPVLVRKDIHIHKTFLFKEI